VPVARRISLAHVCPTSWARWRDLVQTGHCHIIIAMTVAATTVVVA